MHYFNANNAQINSRKPTKIMKTGEKKKICADFENQLAAVNSFVFSQFSVRAKTSISAIQRRSFLCCDPRFLYKKSK